MALEMNGPGEIGLARGWLEAAQRPAVGFRLGAIYAMIADQVAARGPVCDASGRCCNFESYGHRLYVTGLEGAWFVQRLPAGTSGLSREGLEDALVRGGCPFQSGLLCGVHGVRPMGCRTYYCDPTAQGWQEALHERCHGLIRALHVREGVEYRYMEWRALLGMLLDAIETQYQE